MVKNRRKDGGYYWVLANVTPIMERGETICYASVRVKPTREQVEAAEGFMRGCAAVRAAFALSAGQPKPTGLRGSLARLMLWRLTGVRSRMLAWACLACALFLGASGVAIAALYDSMDTRELAAAGALLAAGVALIFASGASRAPSPACWSRPPISPGRSRRAISARRCRRPACATRSARWKFSLEVMRKSLVSITRDVHQGIESALHSAAEIADGNADLSAHTQRQAASLEEAAASMAQLASTVKQNASSLRGRPPEAGQATDVRRGGEVVGDAVQAMQGIVQSTSRISEIVGIIDGIAFQTNILALNAAVEAARRRRRQGGWWWPRYAAWRRKRHGGARDQGTDRDIQPAGGRRRAPRGARRRRHADIETSVKQVTQIVNEIAAISSEQHTGIDNVSRTISETDTAAQRNAARVEQASLAVDNCARAARTCAMPSRCSGCRRPGRHAQASRGAGRALPSPRRQIPLLERQPP